MSTLNFAAGFSIEGQRDIIFATNINNTMKQEERKDIASLLLDLHVNKINYVVSRHKCIFFLKARTSGKL